MNNKKTDAAPKPDTLEFPSYYFVQSSLDAIPWKLKFHEAGQPDLELMASPDKGQLQFLCNLCNSALSNGFRMGVEALSNRVAEKSGLRPQIVWPEEIQSLIESMAKMKTAAAEAKSILK